MPRGRGCRPNRVEPCLPSKRTRGSTKAWKRASRARESCMHSPQSIDVTLEKVARSLRASSVRSARRQITENGTGGTRQDAEGQQETPAEKNGVP